MKHHPKLRNLPKVMNPAETWTRACEVVRSRVEGARFEEQGDVAVESAKELLALSYRIKGVACEKCGGVGERTYASTSTWRGGMGGASITPGVCDECWGSGRTDRKGPDQRKIEAHIRELQKETSRRWFEERIGANLAVVRKHFPVVAQKLRRARWKEFWETRTAEVVAGALEELAGEMTTDTTDVGAS